VLLALAALLASCASRGGRLPAPRAATAVVDDVARQQGTTGPDLSVAVEPSSAEVAQPTVVEPPDGAVAFARGAVRKRPYVVMIDNHPDAYPQSGLLEAAVVFEALAEYGITRLMAIYDPGAIPQVAQIGPVRSTRLYFAQWALAFQPIYVHAGGSPQGLSFVTHEPALVDLDGLRAQAQPYFTRSVERYPPHNLYTGGAALDEFAAVQHVAELATNDIGFPFKAEVPFESRPFNQNISYYFVDASEAIDWHYDRFTNKYLRLYRSLPARDAVTRQQIWTKNLVVLEVPSQGIPDDIDGRLELDVIGTGRGQLFVDGVDRAIEWRKESAAETLRFYTEGGDEVALNGGPVWIVALPTLDQLTLRS
jgi:hypothetical protein